MPFGALFLSWCQEVLRFYYLFPKIFYIIRFFIEKIYITRFFPINYYIPFLQVANRLRELPVNENLPWAILSGNKDFTEQKKRYIIIYGEKSGYVDFFNKESNDIKNLWEKIIEAVEGLPDTKIKREHQKAFEMCREYLDEKSPQRLLKAIKKAEWIESDMDYTDSFLVLRKILEQLFKKLNHIGLIPDEIYDSKGWINPSFDIISDAEKNGFKIEQGLIHPTIGFLLKQLKPVTQDAEHGNNEKLGLKVDDFVTNSKTPYLYRSSLNQLLEVLAWFKKFIDEHPNKEDNKKLYVRVEPEYIGKIEKDNNIYHCGQYVLYPKYVEENNYKIGDEIAITKSKDNTNKHTKERYPKYADRFNKS